MTGPFTNAAMNDPNYSGDPSDLFNIDDAHTAAALAIIEKHTATMRTAINEVESVKSSVGTSFQSLASSSFQTQLTNWTEIYGELLTAFRTVSDDLNVAARHLDQIGNESVDTTHALGSTISSVLAG